MAIELIDESEGRGLWTALVRAIIGVALVRPTRKETRGFHSADEARRFEREMDRVRTEARGGPW